MPTSPMPKLMAYPSPKPTKREIVLKWLGRIVSKSVEFFIHSMMLSLFCTVGWVLSQTFVGAHLIPALKKLMTSYSAMILPTALAPWGGWILLGGIGAIMAGNFLFAVLSGTLLDKNNHQRSYGTWLYIGVSWLAPAIKFTFSHAKGAEIGSALIWTGILGGGLGILTSSLVPILDNPMKRQEILVKLMQFAAQTLIPALQKGYQKISHWFNENIYPIVERFIPKEITPEPPPISAPLPPQRFEDAVPAAPQSIEEVAAQVPIVALPASLPPQRVEGALPAPVVSLPAPAPRSIEEVTPVLPELPAEIDSDPSRQRLVP